MTPIALVIPCFNLGHTVTEALDSVIEQSRPAAEILIVDDGSTDLHTRQVLADLGRTRVRVIRTDNRGLSSARNLGVRLTHSPLVVTLDADDRLERSYLEKTSALLDTEPTVGFVSTGIQAFGERQYVWTPPECSISNALTRGSAHPASMFRRTLWEAVGGFDEVTPIHGCEDVDFWLSAMVRGFRGVVIPEPLLLYRVRHDSMHQQNVASGRHLRAMEALLRKHRTTVALVGPELLVDKERFRLELMAHTATLEQRRAAISETLRALDTEIESELAGLGYPRRVDLGDLSLSPISPEWGFDRGEPIDRLYIHGFLDRHRADVQGRVLEVKDLGYTTRFKGDRTVDAHVIDIDARNPHATIVADLTRADDVPGNQFDCFILTQTLHMIFDIGAALRQAERLLKPGGVLLCTIPAVSRVDYERGTPDAGDYWRMTRGAVLELFAEVFPVDAFTVDTYGNVATCAAFLYGLAKEDLQAEDLAFHDPWFPLIHCVRAVKPHAPRSDRHGSAGFGSSGAVLLYHRIANPAVDPFGLCIAPDRFREQVRFLQEHCRLMSLVDFVAAAEAAALPPRAVAVTFDDVYRDNLTIASPILAEFGVPATFFATTDRIDEEHEFWWDTLTRLLLQEPTLPTLITGPEGLPDIRLESFVDRRRALTSVHSRVRLMPVDRRERVLSSLIRQIQPTSRPEAGDRPMTASELRELASRPGHDIGAHTTHHLSLPSLPAETRTREMVECKAQLESLLGRAVFAVAYPFGEVDARTAAVAREAGFTIGVGVGNRYVFSDCEPLLVPRLEVVGDIEGLLRPILA